MSDIETEPSRLRATLVHARPLLLPLAVLCGVLTLWLAWSGWQQVRDGTRRATLETARDSVAVMTAQTLAKDFKRMADQLAAAPVQAALAGNDLAAAGAALRAGMPGVEDAEVLPVDLSTAYAGLPKTSFGRIAVAEAALSENRMVSWVIREDGGARLAIAAPARHDGRLAGVAYVRLPLSRVTVGLDSITLADDTYMALRQGGFTLLQRGEAGFAEGAERMAIPVEGSGLRVAAAVPNPAPRPFGLGQLASLVAAALFAGLALMLLRASRKVAAPDGRDDVVSPTLAQVMTDSPQERPAPTLEVKDAPKAQPVRIDRGIFRAYDIRGIIGQSLDAGVAQLIGQAVGSLMAEKNLTDIVVGRDGRLSGPELIDGLVEGLRKAGRNVIDIGMAPTPVIYFGAYHLRTGCCISVTGSHNPPDYNGFKIVVGGETLSGDTITDLYARIAEDRLVTATSLGTLVERDIGDDYVARISGDVQIDRKLRVVVDAGNGVAGELGPRVLEAIGAEVTPLFCEIDGTFPNHHPDPSDAHNLEDLIQMVARLDADLGIAFDGDGDRLGVVTRDGENIFADRLLMLFAGDVLERNPGAMVVYDVKCTGRLPGYILRHGGSPLMWKTGHSLIKAKMRETEAELAGEMSGHFFFAERWYGFDDGIYAAARLLEILAASAQSPSEVLKALPNGISTPEIKVDAPDGDPHTFVERFREHASFEGARLSTIDGLRVDWPDGWGLVRASNTTPVLVMRFDSDSAEGLSRIQEAFRTQLLLVKPDLVLPF